MCGVLLQLAYFCITSLYIIQCRKYDIEAESQKLYGEDLKGVLRKFRKSYDYSQILAEKTNNIEYEVLDSHGYLEDYYKPQISKKVAEILGLNEDGTRKDQDKKPLGRQNEEKEEEHTTLSDVQYLDEYAAKKRILTVPEINSFANLGFEFAGKIIHGIISQMGGNDVNAEDAKSTKLPYPNDDKDITFTKQHDHSVTNEGQFISTAKPENPEPEEDKFAFRANTLKE